LVQRNMSETGVPVEGFGVELSAYAARWPEEAACVAQFEALLREERTADADPYVRSRLAGHLTASSWLVDRSGQRVLLTHHRKLGLWLQLGGHADGERDLRAVALKEAEEESGLQDLVVENELFDLDRHWIPEHKGVAGHWHYDARYVVRATGSEAFTVSDESHALAWRDIADVAGDASMDASLRRMARKWLALPPAT
jgi:8-oxo-dGTP pyrophosphatase MutT (NUDIX family)